ncbi:Ca2+-binding RTX toxin-like protein [Rhodovulum bhavnagarense]|uniref:Ca2+-binding RTX toxin-like protein n=1 Tax=Rhodovulum bhavnagarense TaxID=992286 RepID=A0A4R2RIV3_9RHOB|nr:Hint domain-containing protein [Rhodovulum bhavnagarense]TCP62419.1 Ca2+-binding RTX toxin-like protein [Rhodovulum bhavnagarense]
MATYQVSFYSLSPGALPDRIGDVFVWNGPSDFDATATITDNEPGIEGISLDDDHAGAETATATVNVNGATSTNSAVDAEEVWTVRDTQTGDIFQLAAFDVEQGAAAGLYILAERQLVQGRTYEVLENDTNPDAAAGDIAFSYVDYAENMAEPSRVVDGTVGNDAIGTAYVDDPEGDIVDDGGGTGAGGLGDVIDGRDGDDRIWAGSGADTVFGGAGQDTLSGGAGNDTLWGDGPVATPTTQTMSWSDIGGAGADISNGLSVDMGDMRVNVSVTQGATFEFAEIATDNQYVAAGESFDPDSSVLLASYGSSGDVATMALDFAAETGSGLNDEVQNVAFRINDLDWQPNDHLDRVTVTAYDAQGNEVAVSLSTTGSDTISGNTATAAQTQDATDAAEGSILVQVAGPVARIVIDYDNIGTGASGVWIGDVQYDTVPIAGDDDTLEGGAGDDVLYGGDGADRFSFGDGFGTDIAEGGAGSDILDFSTLTTAISGSLGAGGTGSLGDSTNSVGFSEIEEVVLTGQDDGVDASATTGGIALTGLGGHDTLSGGSGNDLLVGDGTAPAPISGAWNYSAYNYDFAATGDQAFDIEAGTLAGSGTTDDFDVQALINALRGTGGDPNDFGVVYTSTLTPDETGTHGFSLTSDDGSTLRILDSTGTPVAVLNSDGTTLDYLDNDYHQAATTRTGQIDLVAGETYTIEVRYWENAGGNTLDGTITSPSGTVSPLASSPLVSGPAMAEGAGDDVLIGGAGADTLIGGAGNDSLTVAEGDSASGGDGDDYFTVTDYGEPGSGSMTLDGGETGETLGDTLDFNGQLLLGSISYSETDDAAGGLSGTATLLDGTIVNFSGFETIICFAKGTHIMTPRGERPIEELRPDDMVLTADNGPQPLRWIDSRSVPAKGRLTPIRIRAGLFGNRRDLVVSPQHRMLYEGYRAQLLFGDNQVLVPAAHLVDHHQVLEEPGGEVTYFHMMFDRHEIVFAEGARSESFHPGHVGLDAVRGPAREELFRIFPQLRALPQSYGPTSRMCLKRFESKILEVA